MSAGELRGYVRAGFLAPERGSRGELRFSFQDLVFLRTARGLAAARLPPRRIRRALSRLREQLPEGGSLAAGRIAAEGSRIVVEDGTRRWQPESGQILLDFDVPDRVGGDVPPLPRAFREAPEAETGLSAEEWFGWACELESESESAAEAIAAYRRAIELDPAHADAQVNLGRLLHEGGDAASAAALYEAALASRPDDA